MTSTFADSGSGVIALRPLEFRCPACGSLLRTSPRRADGAGRRPACRMVLQIPRRLLNAHFFNESELQTHSR